MNRDIYAWFEFVHSDSLENQPPQAVGDGVAGIMLFGHAEDRIIRCVDGRRWLNQRFHPAKHLQVEVRWAEVAEVVIEEPRPLQLGVQVPMSWPGVGSDGLIGFRATRLLLRILAYVGEAHGLGPPPLRAAGASMGKPELNDPFSFNDVALHKDETFAAWAEQYLADQGRGRFIAVTPADAAKSSRHRAARVVNALGHAMSLTLPDELSEEACAWSIQPRL